MKITAPISKTFTIKDIDKPKRTISIDGCDLPVTDVATHLENDPEFVMRKLVSYLDRISMKWPLAKFNRDKNFRLLSNFSKKIYIERSLLGLEIWKLFSSRFKAQIGNGKKYDNKKLADRWLSKVHPYAKKEPSFSYIKYGLFPTEDKLKDDKNLKLMDEEFPEEAFWGSWRRAFGIPLKVSQRINYKTIAQNIMDHLFQQELAIKPNGGEKRKGADQTGKGHIQAIGEAIVNSTNDPSKFDDEKISEKERRLLQLKNNLLNQDDFRVRELYFKSDIAQNIFEKAIPNNGKEREVIDGLSPQWFGAKLSQHLKEVGFDPTNNLEKELVWTLHNQIRKFYAKIANSKRFKRAVWEQDITKLEKLLPKNVDQLLLKSEISNDQKEEISDGQLTASFRNAELSRYIRLGKLIAHAADIPFNVENPQEEFENRKERFILSDGQSEIKRNEHLVRAWRGTVGMTFRTLRSWSNRHGDVGKNQEGDLSTPSVAKKAVSELDPNFFNRHCTLVFGSKSFADISNQSRSQIFQDTCDGNGENARETMWMYLRLAANLRNKTNHFNTSKRLLGAIQGGLIEKTAELVELSKRKDGRLVCSKSFEKLDKLLEFDVKLKKLTLLEELNQLQTGDHVPDQKLGGLLRHIVERGGQDIGDIAARQWLSIFPRFNSIAKRLVNIKKNTSLPANLREVSVLDMTSKERTNSDLDFCRFGLMRLLYESGFQNWLLAQNKVPGFVRRTIVKVVKAKKARIRDMRSERGRFFLETETHIEQLDLAQQDDLFATLAELSAQSLRQDNLDKKYKVHKLEHSSRSGWIEEFKQELFGYFWGDYLQQCQLGWLWELGQAYLGQPKGEALTLSEIEKFKAYRPQSEPWHAQFYAWLYLVPIDDAMKLRHQFEKTAVLEEKSNQPTNNDLQNVLNDLHWLMGLYAKVQGAGFGGQEQFDLESDMIPTIFGEQTEWFKSFQQTDQPLVFAPGTARGLRQLVRFGSFDIIKPIFEKHQITDDEINYLLYSKSPADSKLPEDENIFTQQQQLRKEIIAGADKLKQKKMSVVDKDEIKSGLDDLCAQYRHLAGKTALHNFNMNAVRLDDYARLHQIMMRVIARLKDFTLMWERDANYVFLGMVYEQLGGELTVELTNIKDRETQGAQVTAWCLKVPKNHFESLAPAAEEFQYIPLWREGYDFEIGSSAVKNFKLRPSQNKLFTHYFYKSEVNRKDCDRGKPKGAKNRNYFSQRERGKYQIRNDFAHYNVLNVRKELTSDQKKQQNFNLYPRLNHRINAVRSLLSYDRKMKNVITSSIKNILAREGFEINWEMNRDRLEKAEVSPRLETHLTMVPADKDKGLPVLVPRHSVRMTSMVKALFEHDTGGYRQNIGPASKPRRRGTLSYPDKFLEDVKDNLAIGLNYDHPEI